MPKITTFLSGAQEFAREHEVQSIRFCVNVMLTEPGQGGTEKDFDEREMTQEELFSLTQTWVEQKMKEAAVFAQDYFYPKR